jgi:alpha-tubulin suppressor-like RCC1 family protein
VACGKTHSVALTDGERVITWGGGAYGQLGNGFGYDAELPSLIESIYNVVSVSAGDFHTIAVSSFAIRGDPPNPLKESKLDDEDKLALQKKRMLDNMHYEPFGKDDLSKKPPVYLVNDRGVTTDKEVRQQDCVTW